MSGGGSETKTHTFAYADAGVDQGQLAQFMQTQEGKQYAAGYDPNLSYAKAATGDKYVFYDPKQMGQNAHFDNPMSNFDSNGNPVDVTAMITAFKAWQSGNAQTQSSWQNYASRVAAEGGGEGDNTITSGPAMGQRRQLLGALANAGNPVPTTPTPGLGSFGANTASTGRKP